MNPGGPKSGGGTPYSVSDTISLETDTLLGMAAEEGFGKRKQAALKALVCRKFNIIWCANGIAIQIFRRDGRLCPLTGAIFDIAKGGVIPILAHIIPNSASNKVGKPF